MNDSNSHKPVLLNEVIEQAKEVKAKTFVDATLGRGGHFFGLLSTCTNGLGIDRDKESIEFVSSKLMDLGFNSCDPFVLGKKQVFLKQANFAQIKEQVDLTLKSIPDIILADLGVSTYQIKHSVPGLSFGRPDDFLDMRLDKSVNVSAADLLNALSQDELTKLFGNLGQVSNSKSLAKNIVEYRKNKKFETVQDFIKAGKFTKSFGKAHTGTKPFMALRIAVNNEHTNLRDFLSESLNYIKKGSLLLIITFHSLEEKKVFKFAKYNNFKITKKAPTTEEIAKNRSARSANLLIIKND